MGFVDRIARSIVKLTGINDGMVYASKNSNLYKQGLDINQLKSMMEMTDVPYANGMSQPVWGPEISTVGAYSREGYTAKTFDRPTVPFVTQKPGLQQDEDVQLALNHLTSQVSGGSHYWKGANDQITEYMEKFSRDIDFDWFDQIWIKELLYYGNTVFKPRLGISNIRGKEDIMPLPISSFKRILWDRNRVPYKYEFRGAEYQGYHNPGDIIHLVWNPVDASLFGTGFGTALTIKKNFVVITPNGEEERRLPSLLDMKYSDMFTTHLAARRYIPRNVYQLLEGGSEDRALLQADLADLSENEDIVASKKLEVTELGSAQRAYDPSKFNDLVQGPIFKALNSMEGKQAGESNHTFANAETSKELGEIGLASFPIAIKNQLMDKLFRPWYETHPLYDEMYGYGMISMPWEELKLKLEFGEIEKRDIEPEQYMKLLELALSTGAVQDPSEMRDLFEKAGLPLSIEYTNMMNQNYNNYQAMPVDMSMQPDQANDFTNIPMGEPPQSHRLNTPSSVNPTPRFVPNPYNPQPSDPRLNFTEKKKTSTKPLR